MDASASLTCAWLPLGSIAADWEYAFRQVVYASNAEGGSLALVDAASREDRLRVLAYSAATHQRVLDRGLVRAAVKGWSPTGPARLVVVACDVAEPDLVLDDVGAMVDAQVPRRIINRHPLRIRRIDELADGLRMILELGGMDVGLETGLDDTRQVVAARPGFPRRAM